MDTSQSEIKLLVVLETVHYVVYGLYIRVEQAEVQMLSMPDAPVEEIKMTYTGFEGCKNDEMLLR